MLTLSLFKKQSKLAICRSKGVTAVTFSYWSLEDMKATIKMLGDILGGDAVEKCNKYIAYLDGNIALVENTLKDKVLEKETLYYINGVSNKGLYKTAGKGSTNSACAQLSHTIFATDSLIESPANKVDSEAIFIGESSKYHNWWKISACPLRRIDGNI